jgi:hypothetical protein
LALWDLALQISPATNGMAHPSGATSYSVNTVTEIDKKHSFMMPLLLILCIFSGEGDGCFHVVGAFLVLGVYVINACLIYRIDAVEKFLSLIGVNK